MALKKDFRSPHSPSPIYGIRPGFNVGDIERQYTSSIPAIASTSAAVAAPTAISPHSRVIKVTVNVTAGTGTATITIKSADDSYTAVIFNSGALSLGTYEFFVGGWSSPTSNNDATYQATQYGPSGANGEATSNLSPSTDNNYVGSTYNPVDFLSLNGSDIKVYGAISGTVTYDVEVTPVS